MEEAEDTWYNAGIDDGIDAANRVNSGLKPGGFSYADNVAEDKNIWDMLHARYQAQCAQTLAASQQQQAVQQAQGAYQSPYSGNWISGSGLFGGGLSGNEETIFAPYIHAAMSGIKPSKGGGR